MEAIKPGSSKEKLDPTSDIGDDDDDIIYEDLYESEYECVHSTVPSAPTRGTEKETADEEDGPIYDEPDFSAYERKQSNPLPPTPQPYLPPIVTQPPIVAPPKSVVPPPNVAPLKSVPPPSKGIVPPPKSVDPQKSVVPPKSVVPTKVPTIQSNPLYFEQDTEAPDKMPIATAAPTLVLPPINEEDNQGTEGIYVNRRNIFLENNTQSLKNNDTNAPGRLHAPSDPLSLPTPDFANITTFPSPPSSRLPMRQISPPSDEYEDIVTAHQKKTTKTPVQRYRSNPVDNRDTTALLEGKMSKSPLQRRRVSVPDGPQASYFELPLENLSDLNANEIQMWMLLQMQKMVQKMEDIHEITPGSTSPRGRKLPSVKKPVPLPRPEVSQDTKGQADVAQSLPFYVNVDEMERALSYSPPPPLPPKTYKEQWSWELDAKHKTLSRVTVGQRPVKQNVYMTQPAKRSQCKSQN